MRVLVTGSRDWKDRSFIRKKLDELALEFGFDGLTIVHGNCPTGADHWANEWAEDNAYLGVEVEPYDADWNLLGRRAGPIRNRKMVNLGADIVLAFPLGKSKGTRGCMEYAEEKGLDVRNLGDE